MEVVMSTKRRWSKARRRRFNLLRRISETSNCDTTLVAAEELAVSPSEKKALVDYARRLCGLSPYDRR